MIDVLYIVGTGRSGSTLLERYLAAHEGTVAVGEVVRLWDRGLDDDRLCSCRVPIKECDFWQQVATAAWGPDGAPAHADARSLTHDVGRTRFIPQMHHRALRTRRFAAGLPRSRALVGETYAAIARVARGRLIVDSSKIPAYAHLLSTVPSLRVAYVHLVRDSRAVAHSHMRVRALPEVHWTEEAMSTYSPVRSAVNWDVRFAASLALVPYVRRAFINVRYEDFVTNPTKTVARIREMMRGLRMPELGPLRDDADPAWYHSLQGNPMRFDDRLSFRPDYEWRKAMPARSKVTVGALTLPFLALHASRIGFGSSR
jgi:hypothetical protein